jgi:predicted membrane channel-forming protein YqfA (hemolysin III family)
MLALDVGSDFLKDSTESLDRMTTVLTFMAVLALVGFILPIIIRSSRTQGLSQKFVSLGDMTGLTKQQIIEIVGPPNSSHYLLNQQILTWQSPGYMITIIFYANDIFQGIQSEHRN